MSAAKTDRRRRRLVRLLVAGVAAVPLTGLLANRPALAAELPRLDPGSDRARQFSYTHDAEGSTNPAREAGARCANCTHFHGRDGGVQWASCNIFPQHRVNADGWCNSWYSAG